MQTATLRQSQALDELKRAVDFFDKVQVASDAEKTAVGTDHWDWLLKASRDARDAFSRP